MSGTAFNIEISGFEKINDVFSKLENPDLKPLMDMLGAEGESQTRRRISEEKTSPAGEPWVAWSADYAETRHAGHSLLQGEGSLLDSQQYQVTADDAVEWGSNLIYAAIQHFGGEEVDINIPARESLGLSAENREDMYELVVDWAEDLMQ